MMTKCQRLSPSTYKAPALTNNSLRKKPNPQNRFGPKRNNKYSNKNKNKLTNYWISSQRTTFKTTPKTSKSKTFYQILKTRSRNYKKNKTGNKNKLKELRK